MAKTGLVLKKRYLEDAIQQLALDRGKMVFISGPRQAGKTTLAQNIAARFDHALYHNWDETKFRRIWAKDPEEVLRPLDLSRIHESRLLILDEIHKSRLWKQKLKGLYDHHSKDMEIIVTGSARLNTYKKGGDSLMGRYLHFRLYPFSLRELLGNPAASPEAFLKAVTAPKAPHVPREATGTLNDLYDFGGFPEPILEKDPRFLNIWRRGRVEKIVREDLRDLSRLTELGQIEALASLLPEKVGNPLSVQSLREDFEVAFDTVKRWLNYLIELYYYFEIRPWTRSIPRSLKKEPKIFLYDWTELESPGARFENLVAFHFLKACHYWTDTGEGNFELHYLRNKEKQEVDFLITRDRKPWLMAECKYSDGNLDTTFAKFQRHLKCPHIQIVREGPRWRLVSQDSGTALVASAELLLAELI